MSFTDSNTIFVKQYGMMRSGTNYTQWLIDNFKNTFALANAPQWKHGNPNISNASFKSIEDDRFKDAYIKKISLAKRQSISHFAQKAWDDDKMRFLVTAKHPYSWYLSWLRSYRLLEETRIGLCSQPKVVIKRKELKFTDKHLAACAKWYCDSYRVWLDYIDGLDLGTFVRYEDLLQDPTSGLKKIKTELELPHLKGDLKLFPPRIDPGGVVTNNKIDRKLYNMKNVFGQFTPRQHRIFEEGLDMDVIARLGYKW